MQITPREHQATRSEILGQQKQEMMWKESLNWEQRGLQRQVNAWESVLNVAGVNSPMGVEQVTTLTTVKHRLGGRKRKKEIIWRYCNCLPKRLWSLEVNSRNMVSRKQNHRTLWLTTMKRVSEGEEERRMTGTTDCRGGREGTVGGGRSGPHRASDRKWPLHQLHSMCSESSIPHPAETCSISPLQTPSIDL